MKQFTVYIYSDGSTSVSDDNAKEVVYSTYTDKSPDQTKPAYLRQEAALALGALHTRMVEGGLIDHVPDPR